ncbi:MAG: hypothetical protein ACLFMX_03280 [Halobacteriales archaeon]
MRLEWLGEERAERVLVVSIYVVALPLALLGFLYLVSLATGWVFGDIIFWLTPVMFMLVFAQLQWGKRLRRANPVNLFFSGPERTTDTSTVLAEPGLLSTQAGRVTTVVTVAIMLGWIFLILEYLFWL